MRPLAVLRCRAPSPRPAPSRRRAAAHLPATPAPTGRKCAAVQDRDTWRQWPRGRSADSACQWSSRFLVNSSAVTALPPDARSRNASRLHQKERTWWGLGPHGSARMRQISRCYRHFLPCATGRHFVDVGEDTRSRALSRGVTTSGTTWDLLVRTLYVGV